MSASTTPVGTPRRGVRDTGGDRVFNTVNYAILTIFLMIILYPLLYILSSSISDPGAVTSGEVWLWPVDPTLIAYQRIFREPALIKGFLNSVFYTVVGDGDQRRTDHPGWLSTLS